MEQRIRNLHEINNRLNLAFGRKPVASSVSMCCNRHVYIQNRYSDGPGPEPEKDDWYTGMRSDSVYGMVRVELVRDRQDPSSVHTVLHGSGMYVNGYIMPDKDMALEYFDAARSLLPEGYRDVVGAMIWQEEVYVSTRTLMAALGTMYGNLSYYLNNVRDEVLSLFDPAHECESVLSRHGAGAWNCVSALYDGMVTLAMLLDLLRTRDDLSPRARRTVERMSAEDWTKECRLEQTAARIS